MSRQSKPLRQPSAAASIDVAIRDASSLADGDIRATMRPITICFRSLREGVANETEWAIVLSALSMAEAIDTHALKRGAKGHIEAGQHALDQVKRRAMKSGDWKPVSLHLQEIDHIRDAIEIHEVQLHEVDRGGYARAQTFAISKVRNTAGGVVLNLKPASEQLSLAGV